MEQYISKSALVVEIENLENTYKKCPTRNSYEEGLKDGRLIGYKDVLHKINSLEVKDPWKPTDKQLEALEWSLGDYRNVIFEERHDTLVSLYNNLKKLKGE